VRHAGKILGRGGDHRSLSAQPRPDQGIERQDTVRSLSRPLAGDRLSQDFRLRRLHQEQAPRAEEARRLEHSYGVHRVLRGSQGVPDAGVGHRAHPRFPRRHL
jgi:hypothetical protein